MLAKVEEKLNEALKRAMKDHNQKTLNIVRMLKSRASEKKTSPGYHGGDLTDQDWSDLLSSYRKYLQKAIAAYPQDSQSLSVRAAIQALQEEISYCVLLDGSEETLFSRDQIILLIKNLRTSNPQASQGQVMGLLMKQHRSSLDPVLTRSLVTEAFHAV